MSEPDMPITYKDTLGHKIHGYTPTICVATGSALVVFKTAYDMLFEKDFSSVGEFISNLGTLLTFYSAGYIMKHRHNTIHKAETYLARLSKKHPGINIEDTVESAYQDAIKEHGEHWYDGLTKYSKRIKASEHLKTLEKVSAEEHLAHIKFSG